MSKKPKALRKSAYLFVLVHFTIPIIASIVTYFVCKQDPNYCGPDWSFFVFSMFLILPYSIIFGVVIVLPVIMSDALPKWLDYEEPIRKWNREHPEDEL